MTETQRVLGQIGAIQTFLENFPMSLLDSIQGKRYSSVFEFVIDLLHACGVNTNDIITTLLQEIYGTEVKVEGGLKELYEGIKSGAANIDEENKFILKLEDGIKGIYMAIISSIFGCSSVPVLPLKCFDYSNLKNGNNFLIKNEFSRNWLEIQNNVRNFSFSSLKIPKSIIDPFGMLEVCPTSSDGVAYYNVEGKDRYYHKIYVDKVEYNSQEMPAGGDYVTTIIYRIYPEDKNIPIEVKYSSNELYFEATLNQSLLKKAIDIKVECQKDNFPKKILKFNINQGTSSSQHKVLSSGYEITSISINGQSSGAIDDCWVYLTAENNIKNGICSRIQNWGSENTETTTKTERVTSGTVVTPYIVKTYQYVECDLKEAAKKSVRVNFVPITAAVTDPEYICCYEGEDPNMLYRTKDMNAFIWYALNKGSIYPQIERNHLMWDNRIELNKNNKEKRINNSKWNEWYNSKNFGGEFLSGDTKPIMQLLPFGSANNCLTIKIPAQEYYAPKRAEAIRKLNKGESATIPSISLNSSIYKYNWDYLKSIRILHPKIMITKMIEYLLGFSLNMASTVDVNFTKNKIKEKVSSAIKKMIESDDMEVEDCYAVFSNDEINEMLEDMLLNRYKSTTYNGEKNKTKTHDVTSYMSMINDISSSTMSGTVTQIKRLITEVTATPAEGEPTIEYDANISIDANLQEKLIWAITMPIVEMLLTPQVLLLMYMNFELFGMVNIEDAMGNDFGKILNLLINKILGMIKSIILFVKDMIVNILLNLLLKVLTPILMNYESILLLEKIQYWIITLKAALSCLTTFDLSNMKYNIDEVNYADIINKEQTTPETNFSC